MLLSLVFVAACDKKGKEPKEIPVVAAAVAAAADASISTYDLPPPPPVVKTPDAYPWREDAGEMDEQDAGGEVVTVEELKTKQEQLIKAKSDQLAEMQAKAAEAKALAEKKRALGKKGYEAWRKKHGKKIPTMVSLDHFEQKAPEFKRFKKKKRKEPRILREPDR